jgi:OOP family OmpA-OmpF porin
MNKSIRKERGMRKAGCTALRAASNMKIKSMAGAVLLCAAALSAQADNGPYIGANLGYGYGRVSETTVKQEACNDDPSCFASGYSEDDHSLGFKVFGGCRLNRYLGLEGGYFNLGELGFDVETNTGEMYSGRETMQGVNVDAVAQMPLLGRLNVFGRLGALYALLDQQYEYSGGPLIVDGALKDLRSEQWGFGLKYGAGISYDLTPAFSVRAEFEGYHMDEPDSKTGLDLYLASVGVVYRFGSSEPKRAEKPEPIIIEKVIVKEVPSKPIVIEKVVVRKVPSEPLVVEAPAKRIVLAADSLFDFDKATLKIEGKAALRDLAGKLHKEDRLVVTGHTDDIGSDGYNLRLSQRRANAVKKQLIALGIVPDQIETRARGEREPVVSNATEEGRAANRRVEIEIEIRVP